MTNKSYQIRCPLCGHHEMIETVHELEDTVVSSVGCGKCDFKAQHITRKVVKET